MTVHQHFIGGSWVAGSAVLDVANPSDAAVMGQIEKSTGSGFGFAAPE